MCSAPALAGSVVDVSLTNMMNGQMGRGWMTGGSMRVVTSTDRVNAGMVSFRVANMGTLVHELVVLPLPATQIAGNRVPTIDGRVDETGSLGEVSGLPAGEFKVSEMNYNGWNRVDYRIVRNDSAIQGFIYER